MEYPGFHFSPGTETFPTHYVVWEYLNAYATHFNLTDVIKFHNLVEKVYSIRKNKWQIVSKNFLTKNPETSVHDAIFVCNGFSSTPSMPNFKGEKSFKGKVLHSRKYRRPESFAGEVKCVLVLYYSEL